MADTSTYDVSKLIAGSELEAGCSPDLHEAARDDFDSEARTAVAQRAQYARSLTRRRAMLWLCSWHTRDSVTLSTAAISFRFMSCS